MPRALLPVFDVFNESSHIRFCVQSNCEARLVSRCFELSRRSKGLRVTRPIGHTADCVGMRATLCGGVLDALLELLVARSFMSLPLVPHVVISFVCARAATMLLISATLASKVRARRFVLGAAVVGAVGFATCPEQKPVYLLSILGAFFAATLTLDLAFDDAVPTASSWRACGAVVAAVKDAIAVQVGGSLCWV